MDFGVIFLSHVESYKEAALAESKGFTHAWFGDSQMVWADVYQCMALCAIKTTTIKLGTNVTNPSSRIAPVTAAPPRSIDLVSHETTRDLSRVDKREAGGHRAVVRP